MQIEINVFGSVDVGVDVENNYVKMSRIHTLIEKTKDY